MDHRDSSRIGPDESGDSFTGFRTPFVRVVSGPAERPWAIGRIVIAAGVVLGFALLMLTGGARAIHSAVSWLNQRDAYLVDFSDVILEPAPPAWIKSGREGLLERVRERAGRPERISALDVDLKSLANDFRRESPWVLAVDRVDRAYPNRLTVHLAYRRPAALLRIGGAEVILDRDGVVLPEDDLNRDAAPLVNLLDVVPADTDPSTLEALPGKLFKIHDLEPGKGDPISDAARLAGFFVDRDAVGTDAGAKLAVKAIHGRGRHYFVETTTATMILWGQAPGSESPGDPKAGEKWALLEKWVESHALAGIQVPAFLGFQGAHVVVRHGRTG